MQKDEKTIETHLRVTVWKESKRERQKALLNEESENNIELLLGILYIKKSKSPGTF